MTTFEWLPIEFPEIATAEQINVEHLLAQSKAAEAVQHATNCGRMLLGVKASLKHGQWLPWLKQQQESGAISFSQQSASTYMRLAANYQRAGNLAESPSIRAALELLSGDNPEQGNLLAREADPDDPEPAPVSAQAVSSMLAELPDTDRVAVIQSVAATTGLKLVEAGVRYLHVSQERNEWDTHLEYIEAARLVMGEIDVDPASSAVANQTVRAQAYFTKETDGLKQEWVGRVWLNPPYSMPLIQQFAEKPVAEFDAGRVEQAVVIVNSATETGWFSSLFRRAGIVCLVSTRVKFWSPIHHTSQPLQGQAIFYFGENRNRFIEVFSQFGDIALYASWLPAAETSPYRRTLTCRQ